MKRSSGFRRQGGFGGGAAGAILALAAAGLGGCDGGGAAFTPTAASEAQMLSIALEPGGEIWTFNAGSPVLTPATGAKLNARVVFTCDGAVAVGAPGAGAALISGLPSGVYATEDDPAFPAGNRRRLVFTPNVDYSAPPSACAAGFAAGAGYSVEVPIGRFGVAGRPLTNAATGVTFSVAGCGVGAFADPVSGAPFVVDSFPAAAPAGGAPGQPVAPESIPQNRMTLTFNEPLDVSGAIGGLQVRDVLTGMILAGTASVAFDPVFVRTTLRYTAASKLPGARTLEFLIPAGIKDYAGNAFAGGPLVFTTAPSTAPADTLVESFDDVGRRGGTSIGAVWDGTGALVFGDLTPIVGDGSDGPGVFAPGVTPLDTDEQIVVGGVPRSRKGVFNYSSLSVAAGATVRIHGPYPAHFRINGPATVDGVIRADAGTILSGTPGVPSYEYGPRGGKLDNGSSVGIPTVPGGRGNGGGGDGGRASHFDVAVPPADFCLLNFPPGLHTYLGENGGGPFIDGLPSTDPNSGGGRGGQGGFVPSVNPENRGKGGAGGTAATIGGDGLSRFGGNCLQATVVLCPNLGTPISAFATPVQPSFIPPISFSTGGSGGGGGGDKLQDTIAAPAFDDQGGGGGGGGGAIRLSVAGPATFNATAVLSANGAQGNLGASSQFAGHGGSGSGGQLWVEVFDALTIAQSSQWSVYGPERAGGSTPGIGCSAQSSGEGGQGLIQLEVPATAAAPVVGLISNGAVVQTTTALPVITGGTVVTTATSQFFDSGRFAPDWLSAVEVTTLGPLAGVAISIRYEGAHVLPDGSGPDLSTLRSTTDGQPGGPAITAATLSTLDGYRYVRFTANGTAPFTAGATTNSAMLPRVESITLTVGG